MTLIIVLNVAFSVLVIVGIVGLHLHAIVKSRAEHRQTQPVATSRPDAAPHRGPDRDAPWTGRRRTVAARHAT